MTRGEAATDRSARVIVLTVPGLAFAVRQELTALPGVRVTDNGYDGRADVVLATVEPGSLGPLSRLRCAEDVLVEVGRTLRSEGDRAPWIGRRLWRPGRVDRAFATWSTVRAAGPGRRRGRQPLTFRVVARVLQERSFHRSELRDQLTTIVARAQPSWRSADPARLEIWVLEYARGQFVAGLRLSDRSMRQRDGRADERTGALRPAVAAALVAEAGTPGTLLDPCCGTGTVLAEAVAVDWKVHGRDIDEGAVRSCRRNVDGASVQVGDARALDLPDAAVDACVSNLPFGRQYSVQGDPDAWLTTVLGELARVTVPRGRVVLLAPQVPRAVVPAQLRFRGRHQLRLLGTTTAMWRYERA